MLVVIRLLNTNEFTYFWLSYRVTTGLILTTFDWLGVCGNQSNDKYEPGRLLKDRISW